MIRMLDHTADVGFELEAPSLEGIFDEARRALLTVMFEEAPAEGGDTRRVRISAASLEVLMVRWINELVYYVQDTGFVPVRADIEITDGSGYVLEGTLSGVPLEPEKYGWQGEVKSATFHGLDVVSVEGGWRARVILDV